MGKNDFLTPKAIANRIKAKGLTKLRWYCQLCQKACRDENGFKCHQTSEGHRRQMELFGQNPQRVVEGYSEEFEREFMDHLRRAHPQARVAAKDVYNEFIAHRHHIHMNSTKWLTLSEFVKYLGREGKCKVDETPKGWFITIIMEDPMKKLSDERRIKRTVREEEEEERVARQLAEQVERARKHARTAEGDALEGGALERGEDAAPIKLALQPAAAGEGVGAGPSGREAGPTPRPLKAAPLFGDDDDVGGAGAGASAPPAKKLSKVEELMQRDLEAKARRGAAAAAAAAGASGAAASGAAAGGAWLVPGIVVKVMSRALREHGYYKQKGTVERVVERFVAELAMSGSGDLVRVDQAELETVIPSPGGRVLVVRGPHRGARGELLEIDTARFQARVRLAAAAGGGAAPKELWFEYEDVCKLATV